MELGKGGGDGWDIPVALYERVSIDMVFDIMADRLHWLI